MENYHDGLLNTGQHSDLNIEFLYKSMIKINKSNEFQNKTLLDAGCGDGTIAKKLTEITKFKKIDGIEINQFAVDHIISNKKENPYENIYKSHILDFQPKEKYDFCILVEVLEHLYVDDVIPVLEKLLNISKCLIITTPSPESCFQLLFNIEEIQNTINNVNELNYPEFESLEAALHKSTVTPFSMRQAGFKVLKIDHPPNYVNRNVRTMVYLNNKSKIQLNKIRIYGIENKNNLNHVNDLKLKYLNLLLESTSFFPMFNYKAKLKKRISYYFRKLKTNLF